MKSTFKPSSFIFITAVLLSISIPFFVKTTHAIEEKEALSETVKRPNILFCMADDWGWPHAGVLGDSSVRTNSFDRIAKEGVLFERAFVSSPSCTPCRNSILAGQQFYRLGAGANLRGPLDVKEQNFMFLLRASGYEIGHFRKAWGPGKFQDGGYKEHPCGPSSSFPDFLKKRDPQKPFCFWFGSSDPHRDYKKGSGKESGIDLDKVKVPAFFPNTEKVRSDIADYYFEVERWNKDVGKAIDQLEETGELENTIVVMTGDHGMPFPRCKGNLYDWGVRVPLAIRWGKSAQGAIKKEFVSLTDLAPTFLEAAGVEIPAEMTGKSLLSIVKEPENSTLESDRSFVVTGRERHTLAQGITALEGYPSRAIRTDDWLLIVNLVPDRFPAGAYDRLRDCDNGPTKTEINQLKESEFFELCFAKRPALELYDCKKDPDQIKNLASDPKFRETATLLESKLRAYLKSTKDPRLTDDEAKFDQYPYKTR